MTEYSEILNVVAWIIFFVVIVLGFANKLVIFCDRNDYGRGVLLAISSSMFYFFAFRGSEDSIANQYFYIPCVFIVTVILLIDSIIFCTRNNGGNVLLGITITICRTIYIVFTVLIVVFLLIPRRDAQGRLLKMRTLFNIAAAGGFTYLSFMLINGRKVRNQDLMTEEEN